MPPPPPTAFGTELVELRMLGATVAPPPPATLEVVPAVLGPNGMVPIARLVAVVESEVDGAELAELRMLGAADGRALD